MHLHRGLLVSCGRNLERAASSEIVHAITEKLEIPKRKVSARPVGISGLVTVRLSKDLSPLEIIEGLKKLDENTPYFIHVLKIKPIEKVIPADLELMKEQIPDLIDGFDGSYKVTAKKRHSSISTDVIIDAAASIVPNPVDLTKYEWELVIEIVGNKMGLAAVPSGVIYSTQKSKEKRKADHWFLENQDE